MRKYIMQELSPEQTDFEFYFDDDGLKSVSGECNAVYINDGCHYTRGFNSEEYSEYYSLICNLMDDYENVVYDSVKELFADCAPDIPEEKYDELKDLIDCCLNDYRGVTNERVAQYLEIKTGKPWGVKSFCGYSQGDYCEVIYCKETNTAELIKEIGHMYLGCGSEFCCIYCDENGNPTDEVVYGYFAIDEIVWARDSRLINYFAEYIGCQPDEIEVQLFDGYIRTPKYKTVEV